MTLVENPLTDSAAADLPRFAEAGDFFALLKPRVMSLVVFTAFVGVAIAPGHLHPILALADLLCIAIGAGAAGALNMWYEADLDRLMRRTRGRPIPRGRIEPGEALAFGLTLAIGSVAALDLIGNATAAALLAFTIFFYVVVYTMLLKRLTPQNIVIGGASGALPPVIGWACVTGTVSWESLSLFLIIFLWTPPHSWALALLKCEDYARAGIPMMPVARGGTSTRWQMLAYAVVLAPVGLLPYFLGFASLAYGVWAGLLGAIFLVLTADVVRAKGDAGNPASAKRLFAFSLFYMAGLFAALLLDRLPAFLGWTA